MVVFVMPGKHHGLIVDDSKLFRVVSFCPLVLLMLHQHRGTET